MVNRPVRERTVDTILYAIDEALANTGYEEIALLSLSSSDYTQIGDLVDKITDRYSDHNLTISLPSLRIESFSVNLMEKLKGVRQGGFTLAPEAATDRMRNRINKPIQAEQLLATAHEIYSRGWSTLKLYFMIGQPGETMEDVQAIADLSKQVIVEGRKAIGKRATLHVGVSTFVPKPHTPFQWASLDPLPTVLEKQNLLKDQLRGPGMKMTWSNPRETILEAALSRGDRNIAKVIETAWRKVQNLTPGRINTATKFGWMLLSSATLIRLFTPTVKGKPVNYCPGIISVRVSAANTWNGNTKNPGSLK